MRTVSQTGCNLGFLWGRCPISSWDSPQIAYCVFEWVRAEVGVVEEMIPGVWWGVPSASQTAQRSAAQRRIREDARSSPDRHACFANHDSHGYVFHFHLRSQIAHPPWGNRCFASAHSSTLPQNRNARAPPVELAKDSMAVDVKQHQTLLTFSRRYRIDPGWPWMPRDGVLFCIERRDVFVAAGRDAESDLPPGTRPPRSHRLMWYFIRRAHSKGWFSPDLQRSKKVPAYGGRWVPHALILRKRAGPIRFVR